MHLIVFFSNKMPGKYKSEEIKNLIVEAMQNGEKQVDVAARYHVSQNTVSRTWNRWKETHSVKNRKITGRPRKTTPGQTRLIVRQVKKDPFMTAVEVRQYAQDNFGITMTDRTARNILIRAGLRGRVPAKKPLISKKNRTARLKFGLKLNKFIKK